VYRNGSAPAPAVYVESVNVQSNVPAGLTHHHIRED
jgi:hypothetical protein